MSRHDRSPARRIRLLSLAILMLNLSAAAAIGQTQRDGSDASVSAPAATGPADHDVESAAAATPVVLPETTVPPPTTAPPAPPTTAVAAPAAARPRTAAAAPPPPPPAPPAPAPAPAAPPQDPAVRVQAAFEAAVPAAWRNVVPVHFQLIEGNTSWASHDGTIQLGSTHYNGTDGLLRATIAHEFGHLIAFRYGSQAYNGAAPDGWPAYSDRPEEAWADCVSRALTGVNDPSHGLPACEGGSLSWTADWVGAGPGAHPRTGT
jgi:hypothetical protein